MAFVALEDWSPITVFDAVPGKIYRCIDCEKPVRLRRFRYKLSHFYHIKASPSCRLYSKSEDHLVAQLYLQKMLPEGETKLEHPFPGPLRVADLLWEPRKIAFEIQCSDLPPSEVDQRVTDYAKQGYQLVWLLDDRLFNRRRLKEGEKRLRSHPCYFAKLRRTVGFPLFYDQFEVLFQRERIKKGRPLKATLREPCYLKNGPLKEAYFPSQIERRSESTALYFQGDLIHQAVRSSFTPSVALALTNLRALERLLLIEANRRRSRWRKWGSEFLGILGRFLQDILQWAWKISK